MKKRLKIGIILIVLFLGGFSLYTLFTHGIMIGRYMIVNDKYLLVNEKTAMYFSVPERLEKKMEKMSIGDELLILHGNVLTSFPGITGADYVFRLSMGDESDLPQETLNEFMMLNVDSDMILDVPMVECEYEGYKFTLHIPEDWEYKIREFTEEDYYDFGLDFWPKGQKEGKISVLSTEMFGVCGTGLKSETMMLGEYEAHKGTYDGNFVWDFIAFSVEDRDYVAMTEGIDVLWWNEYGEKAMNILYTIQVYDEYH